MADSRDPTDLVEIGTIDLTEIIKNSGRDDLDIRLKVTREMGQTAATAATEVAKYQYAVPARNRTYRALIGAAVLVFIGWEAVKKLESKDLSSVLVALAISAGAVLTVRQLSKKKKED